MKVRKAVIPAAGLGTRMLPATKAVPKEMLPLVDVPAIMYIVEEAVASGIEDILIVTNRGKAALEDYFDYSPEIENALEKAGKQKELGIIRKSAEIANIQFIRQKDTKGLGHAVWCSKSFVGNEPFAVLLGDDVMVSEIPVTRQLIDAAETYNASAVGVQEVSKENISKYCTLKVTQEKGNVYNVSDIIEKPRPEQVYSHYAILGRYVLSSEIFNILKETPPGFGGEIQLTDGLNTLCKREKMVAVDFIGRRYDTGNIFGFLEATIDFALARADISPWLEGFLKEKVKTEGF